MSRVSRKPAVSAAVAAYTDEQAQDAVGAALTDTATIDFTYDDPANQIRADVTSIVALLPGRAGGQTLIGGTVASEVLTLQSTSDATRGRINAVDSIGLFSAGLVGLNATNAGLVCDSAISIGAGSSTRLTAVAFGPVVTVVGTVASNSLVLFGATVTLAPDASGRNMQGQVILNSTVALQGFAGGTVTVGSHISVAHNPRLQAIAAAGTGSVVGVAGLSASGSVADGWTVPIWRVVHSQNVTRTGTAVITELVAVDINNLSAGVTNLSLRSLGVAVELRHAGPSLFGATGAPNAGATIDTAGVMAHRVQTLTTAGPAVNDQSLTNSFVRLDPTAAVRWTGFSVAGAAPPNGAIVTLTNVNVTNVATIGNDDTGSLAANRILTKSGADVALAVAVAPVGGTPGTGKAGGSIRLMYDATTARWREV